MHLSGLFSFLSGIFPDLQEASAVPDFAPCPDSLKEIMSGEKIFQVLFCFSDFSALLLCSVEFVELCDACLYCLKHWLGGAQLLYYREPFQNEGLIRSLPHIYQHPHSFSFFQTQFLLLMSLSMYIMIVGRK